ncbi:MAG: SpoIIE family protein phosphatase [Spirochaetia bacterium]
MRPSRSSVSAARKRAGDRKGNAGKEHGHGHLIVLGTSRELTGSFASLLKGLGYSVEATQEEADAFDLLRAGSCDLILVELALAKSDSYGLLKRLSLTPPAQRVPIIVYGASEEITNADRCIKNGADDYLTELLNPAVVAARMEGLLSHRRLVRALESSSEQLAGLTKLSDDFTKVIIPIGIALSAEKDPDLLIEKILVEAKGVCNADAGTLYLRTEEDCLKFEIMHTDSLKIRIGGPSGPEILIPPLPLHDPASGAPNHHNVATHVALEGISINIPDIYNAEGFDFTGTKAFDQRNHYRSISSLTVPLKDHDTKVIGVLQLLNAQDPATGKVKPFDAYLQQIVELLSSQAAIALSNQILMHREKKLLKFENDVQIGRKIQTDFLPDKLPQPPGCEVVSCFHPAREVSGDFYDAFLLPGSSHMGFVIADVCDKGVPAALFMAVIRSLIRAFSEQHSSFGLPILADHKTSAPNSVEHRLATLFEDLNALNTVVMANNYIARTHGNLNMFATLFLGVLDPDTGLLTYVNGGHEAPVIIGANGIESRLGQTGPAVGMMPDSTFELQQYQLKDKDILFAYTDGVPESRNRTGGFFTEKRLFALLEQPVTSAAQLVQRVETGLRDHLAQADQFDDITMIAIRWSSQPPAEVS